MTASSGVRPVVISARLPSLKPTVTARFSAWPLESISTKVRSLSKRRQREGIKMAYGRSTGVMVSAPYMPDNTS